MGKNTKTGYQLFVWNKLITISLLSSLLLMSGIYTCIAVNLPDITIPKLETPEKIFVNETYEVNAIIKNEGQINTSSFNVSFFVNGSQKHITPIDDLLPGEEKMLIFNFTPFSFGTYELKVIADPENATAELNESNNIAIINLSTKPDLSIADIEIESDIATGETVNISALIRNYECKNDFSVAFYASQTKETDVQSPHPYPTNETWNCNKSWNITEDDAISMRVHFSNISLYYARGVKDAIFIHDKYGKLVESYSYPGYPTEVGAYNLSDIWSPWIEGNTVNISLYISEKRYDWQRTYGFFIDKYESILPFGEKIVSFNATKVSMPWNGSVGQHEIAVILDPEDKIEESNETNNKMIKTIYVGASRDFSINDIYLDPKEPIIGDNVEINASINNIGESGNITASFYMGQSPLEETVQHFDANESKNISVRWNATKAGLINITVTVDPYDEVYENNESNNNMTACIYVNGPDLVITNLSFDDSSSIVGNTTNITVKIENIGILNVDNFTFSLLDDVIYKKEYELNSPHPYPAEYTHAWEIYERDAYEMRLHFTKIDLKWDDTLFIYDGDGKEVARYDGWEYLSDIFTPWVNGNTVTIRLNGSYGGWGFEMDEYEYKKSYNFMDSLDANESKKIKIGWNASRAGLHNIFIVIDPKDKISEINESNNVMNGSILVKGADLIVSEISLDKTNLKDGDTVNITAEIKNIGILPAFNFDISILIDENERIYHILTLPPDESVNRSSQWNATTGSHLITVIVDPLDEISETYESNNIAVQRIENVNGADLIGLSLRFDKKEVFDEESVNITAEIKNQGYKTATFDVGFYDCKEIYAYKSLNKTEKYTFISKSFDGSDAICINITDIKTEVEIWGKDQNISYHCHSNEPCLVVVMGDTINIYGFIGLNHLFYADFYAASEIGMKSTNLEINETKNTTIVWNATAGNHHIMAFADPENAVKENEERNNFVLGAIRVILTKDFAVLNMTLDEPIIDGDTVKLNATVKNAGIKDGKCEFVFIDVQNKTKVAAYGNRINLTDNGTDEIRIHFSELKIPALSRIEISNRKGEVLYELGYGNTTHWTPWFETDFLSITKIGKGIKLNIDRYESKRSIKKTNISLSANETGYFRTEWNATAGNHMMTVTADQANEIGEMNESNNEIIRYVNVTPSKDPSVIGLEIAKQKNHSLVTGFIKNKGIRPADFIVELSDYREEKYSLASNVNKEGYRHTWTIEEEGADRIGIHFDKINMNKAGDHSLCIYDKEGIEIEDYSYFDGSDIWVWARESKIEIKMSYKWGNIPYFYIDKFAYEKKINSTDFSLDANESEAINDEWDATAGNHKIILKVDPLDEIIEINESNNEMSRDLCMDAPDLTVSDARLEGDEIIASVENVGLLNASNITTAFCSDHNYSLDSGRITGKRSWTVSHENASRIRVHFEDITINGALYAGENKYEEETSDGWTDWVKGGSINIVMDAKRGHSSRIEIDKYSYGFDDKYIKEISLNSTKQVSTTFNEGGCHELTIIVDPDDEIEESNEYNNERTLLIGPDIVIDSSKMMTYPEYPLKGSEVQINTIVENKGNARTGEFNVTLYMNETPLNTSSVNLAANEDKNLTFFWLPPDNGTYNLSIKADPENSIEEVKEDNNKIPIYIKVYPYSGYAGGLSLVHYDNGEGNIFFTLGNSYYLGSDSTSEYPVDFHVPDVRIKLARLYLYWGWSYNQTHGSPILLKANMKFNGFSLGPESIYNDPQYATELGGDWGTYCYDVTGYVKSNSTNTAILERIEPETYKSIILGMGLLIVYDEEEMLRKYWIAEGADALWACDDKTGLTWKDCITSAEFKGIDKEKAKATLITVVPSGGEKSTCKEPQDHALFFNGEVWEGRWWKNVNSSDVAVDIRDMTAYLHGNNKVEFQDRGSFIVPANAFLVVSYPPDIEPVLEKSKSKMGEKYPVKIRNNGRSRALGFNVDFYVDGKLEGSEKLDSLDAESDNTTLYFKLPVWAAVGQTINVTVMADSGYNVSELSETNNNDTRDVTIIESEFELPPKFPRRGGDGGGTGTGFGEGDKAGNVQGEGEAEFGGAGKEKGSSEEVDILGKITGYLMSGIATSGESGGSSSFSRAEYLLKFLIIFFFIVLIFFGYLKEWRYLR